MPLKGILFASLFLLCSIGALFVPTLGVYGYFVDYCIGTSHQWWASSFAEKGIRISLILALATFAGMCFNWGKLKFGNRLLIGQEILLLLFLFALILSSLLGAETIGRYTTVDTPPVKFAKLTFFTLMMTHIITDTKKLNGLLWVFVLVALFLGVKAWLTPRSWFIGGRLETLGGADFRESNFLAAFMAAMLPFIGIQFIRSKWLGKIICFFSAAFTVNTIVLCRSRGAFLAIFIGIITAFIFSPRKHRKKIIFALILGIFGGIYLSDPQIDQ